MTSTIVGDRSIAARTEAGAQDVRKTYRAPTLARGPLLSAVTSQDTLVSAPIDPP
jgi:hypothetical protein